VGGGSSPHARARGRARLRGRAWACTLPLSLSKSGKTYKTQALTRTYTHIDQAKHTQPHLCAMRLEVAPAQPGPAGRGWEREERLPPHFHRPGPTDTPADRTTGHTGRPDHLEHGRTGPPGGKAYPYILPLYSYATKHKTRKKGITTPFLEE
jgi:hypothetical protein